MPNLALIETKRITVQEIRVGKKKTKHADDFSWPFCLSVRQAWQMPTIFGREIKHKKSRIIVSVRSYYFSLSIKKKHSRYQKTQNLMLISNPLKGYKKANLKKVRGSRTFEHKTKR
jgi:hypothetical protein